MIFSIFFTVYFSDQCLNFPWFHLSFLFCCIRAKCFSSFIFPLLFLCLILGILSLTIVNLGIKSCFSPRRWQDGKESVIPASLCGHSFDIKLSATPKTLIITRARRDTICADNIVPPSQHTTYQIVVDYVQYF